MNITSLQVCMDSSDWLQGPISEDGPALDSSPITTPTGDEMLTCNRPIRLRPTHEQAQKCPRCESTHTKFCYYNNYSLSQPRYFCKTCRRYWTKGGTLRNIPVGGGCRKNKKSKKPPPAGADHHHHHSPPSNSSSLTLYPNTTSFYNDNHPADLHLVFPELYLTGGTTPYALENPTPIDFMENKYEALLGGNEGHVANGESYGGVMAAAPPMVPYENYYGQNNQVEVKPNDNVLSLEWHDNNNQQGCNSGGDSFGYNFGGLGSWTGLMNRYGSSAMNPLV